jgi:hypothetical protein
MAYRGWRRNGTKYNATKITADGHTFDSKHEYQRYCELKLLERGGVISDLQMQVKFVLIPSQYEPDTVKILKSGKEKVVKGKLIERECSYIADFVYQYNGNTVVEDSKGFRTKEYIIKRKLLRYKYGIAIQEV